MNASSGQFRQPTIVPFSFIPRPTGSASPSASITAATRYRGAASGEAPCALGAVGTVVGTVVEPEGWDDMRRSLEAGWIEPVGDNPPPTACDALQTTRVSPLTFEVLARRGAEGVAVSEAEVAAAQRFAAERLRLVVEPGGAVALGAVLAGKVDLVDDLAIVVSGGNIDPALHSRIIQATR